MCINISGNSKKNSVYETIKDHKREFDDGFDISKINKFYDPLEIFRESHQKEIENEILQTKR